MPETVSQDLSTAKTTITIMKKTRDRIKQYSMPNNSRKRRENFDVVLNRLVDHYEQTKK